MHCWVEKDFNVMRASADDIKIVAKLGKDESLPFGVMQVCGSLNKL